MKKQKLLQKVIAGKTNIRFQEICSLAEVFGFRLDRISGSHYIYVHPQVPELVNLQNVKGKAKPYQIRQFLAIVEKYNLQLREDQ